MLLKAYCWVVSHLRSEEGATAVEYGLLVAVIALVMVAGAILLGAALRDLFARIATTLGLY